MKALNSFCHEWTVEQLKFNKKFNNLHFTNIYESVGGNIDVFIDFHELLMEQKFCVIFPKYKNTNYVQNN